MSQNLMDVLVDGRSTGKTTLLLDWLRAGQEIDAYPGWSRVVVCMHDKAVPMATQAAKDRFGNGPWAKCVFSVSDLRSVFRGAVRAGTIEYAIDDIDVMIGHYLDRYVGAPQDPALVTITGAVAYR